MNMTIHHIIELLELYPIPFNKYYGYLSSNLNLTFEYVLNHHANGCWDYQSLSINSSIATMQTISKVSWNWHFMSLLSNSAFTEKEVSTLLANKSLNHYMIYCLGQNKNISPEFEPIKEKWWMNFMGYASNEKFIPLINKHLISSANDFLHINGNYGNYFRNSAVTIDMFLYLLTKETFHDDHQHFILEFITHNPNVMVDDLKRFGFGYDIARREVLLSNYLLNINAILPIVLEHPHMETLSFNPHLQMEELLELIKNEPYEEKLMNHEEYSFNHNLSWENICDYSWLSFNWKHLASNSFSNSPQYREVTLMRELLELQCICYYPGLAEIL